MLKDKKAEGSWRGFSWGADTQKTESAEEKDLVPEDLESVSGGNTVPDAQAPDDVENNDEAAHAWRGAR